MSMFDGLLGRGTQKTLDVPKAIMTVMVAAVKVDGSVEQDEINQIRSICAWSPIYVSNSVDEDSALIRFADSFTSNDGIEAAVKQAAGVLNPPLRETAFAFATRIAFADSFVGDQERTFLMQLAGWLSLDSSRARQIVEVVSIMNHDASA